MLAEHVKLYESHGKLQLDTLGRILDAIGANLCDVARALDASVTEPEPQARPVLPPPRPCSMVGDGELVAQAVLYLRQRQGLRLEDFAQRVGVSVASVQRYEGGRSLRLATLGRILEGLDASLLDFHEALVLADAVRAWQQADGNDTAQLRAALLHLGKAHTGAVDEDHLLGRLRGYRETLRPSR